MREGGKEGGKVGGVVNVGEWIHVTFADWDAHGPADCLAIFKLRHDNEHATEGGQSQPSRDMEQENTQTTTKKRG